MTRKVIVVPGFSGTTLNTNGPPSLPLWVEYSRLATGQVGKLRLGPDGSSPGAPDGVSCSATTPLSSYYGSCISTLHRQLAPDNYEVMSYGYDWRMRIRGNGELVASLIRSVATLDEPATLVAHSLGGLVSRAAWSSLLGSGDQGLCRRIITLGTPHQGSYYAVELFSLTGTQVVQLAVLSQAAAVITGSLSPALRTSAWTVEDLSKLFATWPSLYEAFPVLGSADSDNDPNRGKLYESKNWPEDRGISQMLLDESRNSWGPFLLSAVSKPPSHVMTSVAGFGFPTPLRLQMPSSLGKTDALEFVGIGDGVVTVASALMPESSQYRLNVLHADLPMWTANTGQLRDWILEERSPVDPVPPVTVDTTPAAPLLDGPPVPVILFPGRKVSCMRFAKKPVG